MGKTYGGPFFNPWCGRSGSGTHETSWALVPCVGGSCVSLVPGAGGDAVMLATEVLGLVPQVLF